MYIPLIANSRSNKAIVGMARKMSLSDLIQVIREVGSIALLAWIVNYGLQDMRLQRQQFLDALDKMREQIEECCND